MTTDDERLGRQVPGWTKRPWPPATPMVGRYCTVTPLDVAAHGADLYAANATDTEDRIWDYLLGGPYDNETQYFDWLQSMVDGGDPYIHAVLDGITGKAVGIATYLRIDMSHGSIEVGHINYSPLLQRKPAGTEAMYLMMARAFDELGYRRYEWKCNSLNERSMRAARRYGFTAEGIHRQALVAKGRNRDTAWFSILDSEWPAVKQAFESWLDPSNFDEAGTQRKKLEDFR